MISLECAIGAAILARERRDARDPEQPMVRGSVEGHRRARNVPDASANPFS